jgi:formylglycine-generating enzyme required for sulfatase activity
VPASHAQITPDELVAPKLEISGGNLNFTIQPSVSGRNYQLQCSDTMTAGTWQNSGVVWSGNGGNLVIPTPYDAGVRKRFYRFALFEAPAVPEGFSLIPAGSFQMGNALAASGDGDPDELPVHTVDVSAFFMAKYEVTKALWDEVRTWGLTQGYTDLMEGSGKASTHPVNMISWHDMVKWCNARSQKDGLTPCYYTDAAQTVVFKMGTNSPNGIDNTMVKWSANGYRLPTEAEWEKAARGGLSGQRFPWGDIINHSYANYFNSVYFYESPQNQNYHPLWSNNNDVNYPYPYTSPVGSFAANGYGLYDMAGNSYEWCWDWYGAYPSTSQTDPQGVASGTDRVLRGGCWLSRASYCRVSFRNLGFPFYATSYDIGFRPVRSLIP